MTAHNNGTVWDRPYKPWALPGGRKVTSADSPRAVWLQARREVIGGSDVADLFGVGYGDEWSLWADKTGRAPEQAATAAMDRGRLLEQGIIDLWALHYADYPIELQRAGLVVSRRWPHLGATVDRLSICELGRCLVEVKSQADSREWENEAGEPDVPTKFQFQGAAQLAATGRDHVHFVVMGPRFVPFERIWHRDDALITAVGEKVEAWWQRCIVEDRAPVATGASSGLIKRLFPAADGMKHVMSEDEAAIARELGPLKAERDAAAAAYDDSLAALQAKVGQATDIVWPDGTEYATWRPGRTIDGATLKWRKAHPELAEAYRTETPSVDVKALVADHPELLEGDDALRFRRTWSPK